MTFCAKWVGVLKLTGDDVVTGIFKREERSVPRLKSIRHHPHSWDSVLLFLSLVGLLLLQMQFTSADMPMITWIPFLVAVAICVTLHVTSRPDDLGLEYERDRLIVHGLKDADGPLILERRHLSVVRVGLRRVTVRDKKTRATFRLPRFWRRTDREDSMDARRRAFNGVKDHIRLTRRHGVPCLESVVVTGEVHYRTLTDIKRVW